MHNNADNDDEIRRREALSELVRESETDDSYALTTGEPFAYTPDEVIAEGQARLRESHPEVWEAWLRWCREEDGNENPVD